MKKLLILGILLLAKTSFSQEINCQVTVNAKQTGQTNLSVFKTLEQSVAEFINETNWTNEKFEEEERINCSMFINITQYDAGSFSATLQIQSSRPVYGSTMTSPILNFNDENFSFQYMEFESLDFNPNSFDSNLVSVISFYVYTILGLDADTFSPLGGSPYFQEAQRIVSTAQQSGYSGWAPNSGNQSRYQYNRDILSPSFEVFREALYNYHRNGLDMMQEDVKLGKQNIAEAIQEMGEISGVKTNSIVLRSFFDAKSNEIEKIFGGGPSVEITEIIETLNDIAPQNSKNWQNISY